MTLNLFKSMYLGPSSLTEKEAQDIPYPRAELHYHVATKCAQAGCILGMGVIGPLLGLVRGRSLAAVKQHSIKTGKVMTAIFLPLAPVMVETILNKKQADEYQVWDRAYRIRMNQGQMRADRYADAGLLLGLGGAAATGSALLPGAMAGFALGTVTAGVVTNVVLKNSGSK